MPVNEGPLIDQRTEFVHALVEWARDDDWAYRERAEQQREAAAKKASMSERMRRVAQFKRPHAPPRPWQGAGFTTRAAWEAAGSPTRASERINR